MTAAASRNDSSWSDGRLATPVCVVKALGTAFLVADDRSCSPSVPRHRGSSGGARLNSQGLEWVCVLRHTSAALNDAAKAVITQSMNTRTRKLSWRLRG